MDTFGVCFCESGLWLFGGGLDIDHVEGDGFAGVWLDEGGFVRRIAGRKRDLVYGNARKGGLEEEIFVSRWCEIARLRLSGRRLGEFRPHEGFRTWWGIGSLDGLLLQLPWTKLERAFFLGGC